MTEIPIAKEHHFKETKESTIHKGEKCKVTFHRNLGNWGVDGGYEEISIEATDETSQKAYETMRMVLRDTCGGPQSEEKNVKVNKRASSAVDIA